MATVTNCFLKSKSFRTSRSHRLTQAARGASLFAVLALVGCGGGSSESGSGEAVTLNSYSGFIDWNLRTRGDNIPSRDPVNVTINGDSIVVRMGPGVLINNLTFSGKLRGNSFSMSLPTEWRPGRYTCRGTSTVEGTVTSVIRGRFVSDLVCESPGLQNERVTSSAPWGS